MADGGKPAFPPAWRLTGAEPITETFSSRIWKVTRDDGSLAVVKALKPFDDVYDELRGGYYLRWRAGEGAVELYEFEGQDMLIEYAGSRLLVDEIDAGGDDHATEIAAEVVARLHSPSERPAPPELQPLAERFESLFQRAAIDRDAGAESLYVDAAALATGLLSDQRDVRPLHGDLHHENIMLSPRGWLAIDPKGVLGDPSFDVGNFLYNPPGRDELCTDVRRITSMTEIFARALQLDPRRILDFAFAYGCLSAAWYNQDNNAREESREFAIAGSVREARRQFA